MYPAGGAAPIAWGRKQLILDLSRQEVLDYLKETVGGMLAANRISYVKWDMNRHMTDAYSRRPAARNGSRSFFTGISSISTPCWIT